MKQWERPKTKDSASCLQKFDKGIPFIRLQQRGYIPLFRHHLALQDGVQHLPGILQGRPG
jgi:hypothetical protein